MTDWASWCFDKFVPSAHVVRLQMDSDHTNHKFWHEVPRTIALMSDPGPRHPVLLAGSTGHVDHEDEMVLGSWDGDPWLRTLPACFATGRQADGVSARAPWSHAPAYIMRKSNGEAARTRHTVGMKLLSFSKAAAL